MTDKFTTPSFADYSSNRESTPIRFLIRYISSLTSNEVEKLLKKKYKKTASAGQPTGISTFAYVQVAASVEMVRLKRSRIRGSSQ